MKTFFIRCFLSACALGICLLLDGRAHAESPSVGEYGHVKGFGCDSVADAKRLVPVAKLGGDIAAAASARKIACRLFDGNAIYLGPVEDSDFRVGASLWRVILFTKEDGTPLYTPEFVPTATA